MEIQPIQGPTNTMATPQTSGPSAFAQALIRHLEHVNSLHVQADALTESFAAGADVDIHKVAFASAQAHTSMAMVLAVRNRLVDAYQEIMRMQV